MAHNFTFLCSLAGKTSALDTIGEILKSDRAPDFAIFGASSEGELADAVAAMGQYLVFVEPSVEPQVLKGILLAGMGHERSNPAVLYVGEEVSFAPGVGSAHSIRDPNLQLCSAQDLVLPVFSGGTPCYRLCYDEMATILGMPSVERSREIPNPEVIGRMLLELGPFPLASAVQICPAYCDGCNMLLLYLPQERSPAQFREALLGTAPSVVFLDIPDVLLSEWVIHNVDPPVFAQFVRRECNDD